ncbi:hypothetical protein QBC43DRAFT_284866 [Cladorrhinum sp. PSN259]|nr:hypothetical protein QBC43DRAFT_284866 [Cladorrhinum sp. PSN259]
MHSPLLSRHVVSLKNSGYCIYPAGNASDPDFGEWAKKHPIIGCQDDDDEDPFETEWKILEEISMAYPQEVISYAVNCVTEPYGKREFGYLYDTPLYDMIHEEEMSPSIAATGFAVLISLCPNLQQLSIPWLLSAATTPLSWDRLFGLDKSQQKLEELVIQYNMGQVTTSWGFLTMYDFSRPELTSRIWFPLPLTNLKTLCLDSRMSLCCERFECLLSLCTNLDAIVYTECRCSREFGPSEVVPCWSIKLNIADLRRACTINGTINKDYVGHLSVLRGVLWRWRYPDAELSGLEDAIEKRWSSFGFAPRATVLHRLEHSG